jgi:hypothetical protein
MLVVKNLGAPDEKRRFRTRRYPSGQPRRGHFSRAITAPDAPLSREIWDLTLTRRQPFKMVS